MPASSDGIYPVTVLLERVGAELAADIDSEKHHESD